MVDIIEHENNDCGDSNEVIVSDSNSRVSLKIYQDVYHQITGRTEQIRKRYSDNLMIEFSDIEQLHYKIQQLCDVHKIVASNETITVFHHRDRKEQFTSFVRFKAYNANATNHTVIVVIKYNFSIILSGIERPQEYTVSIKLKSRAAMIDQMLEEAPSFIRPHLAGLATDTAEITIDYADYVIARGFLESFDEWVKGCKKTKTNGWLKFARKWSHLLPGFLSLIAGIGVSLLAFNSIPNFFHSNTSNDVLARFFVVYMSGAFVVINLMGSIGSVLEEAFDGYPIMSYLKLNKGDEVLINDFKSRKKSVVVKFIFSAISAIILGIISTKLERFI